MYFKPLVNILALLVDEKYRRTGIGRKLVGEAKKWALKNKFYGLRVISGNGKETASAFYKALDFIFIKTQGNFQIKFDKER